jgi:carboxyl-terminal processing protease
MRKGFISLVFLIFSCLVIGQNKYQKDFDYFCELIEKQYAYFDLKQTDWKKVKELYNNRLQTIKKDWEFTYTIELMKHELYDPHLSLNRNVEFSFRLIPNDTDAYIKVKNGNYYIADIRENYSIEDFNLKIGDQLVKVNGQDIEDVIKWNLPASIENPGEEVKEYFANLIFAGRHNKPREFQTLRDKKTIEVQLPKATAKKNSNLLLESEILSGNIGYVKINNSLGNYDLIRKFPKEVDDLANTEALIIDLRETHSGGNTVVAKAIMGKFITKEMPYQVHERVGLERELGIKRKYIEILSPLENPYRKPVYILVSRWTGSVGEAIAQGFSNIDTATVVGTTMAQLLGAITCYTLPDSGLRVCFPFEKLYNVDGTPREDFKPDVSTISYKQTFQKTLELIRGKK